MNALMSGSHLEIWPSNEQIWMNDDRVFFFSLLSFAVIFLHVGQQSECCNTRRGIFYFVGRKSLARGVEPSARHVTVVMPFVCRFASAILFHMPLRTEEWPPQNAELPQLFVALIFFSAWSFWRLIGDCGTGGIEIFSWKLKRSESPRMTKFLAVRDAKPNRDSVAFRRARFSIFRTPYKSIFEHQKNNNQIPITLNQAVVCRLNFICMDCLCDLRRRQTASA